MEVLHGIDAVLFFRKNEEWVPYGCAENVEVVVTTEYISVKTIGDGQWDTTRAQKYNYTVSCSGIAQYDDEDNRQNAFDLLEYQVSGTHVEWHISFKQNDKTTEFTQLRGYALITSTNISAPVDFVNTSLEMRGKGELLRGAPPSCTAEIDDYTVERRELGFIYDVEILELVSGTVPSYHWRLDGGAINTALSTGWSFSVAEVGGYGDHVLEIWPVCDNGVEGVKTTHNFSTTL
jgi:hypothetical protein